MNIHILFFGVLKELVGKESDSLSLPGEPTLADVLAHYRQRIPRLQEFASSIAMSVNQEYATRETRLKENDEVALLPPVSGGSTPAGQTPPGQPAQPRRCASIVRDKINAEQIANQIKQPEDGAVAVFEGIVRNHSRGRRTLFLDYEAYEEMALKQLEGLAAQARTNFSIRDVVLVHRLGRLEIGETSILIVVASAHRGAAFDACRWLIDTLKRTVPIWKKEHFEDGAVWADGEPFPPDIASGPGSPAVGRASK